MARRASLGQFSFNGGEISPRLHGRVDQDVYAISTAEMTGWIPFIQGPVTAAPGTIFVEEAAGPCRLIPFEYNVTQGYVIEASELKFRFYTNDARIDTAPDTPFEVVSPYSFADLADLDYQQSADVLYLVGAGKQQRKLSRTGAETFTIDLLELSGGPIGPGNSDDSITVTASGTTGSVTLTASSAIFAATDVGSLFELEAKDFSDVKSWEPDRTVSLGEKRSWAGKVYQCASNAAGQRTGTIAPVHDEGTEWDGDAVGTDVAGKGPYGVQWTFLYGRHGLLEITAFTDSTHVTATVIDTLADSLTSVGSWRWAFGAFSDTRGWPDVVCLWNERLVLTKDNVAYVSVVGGYDNFRRRDSSGDFQRDLASSVELPSSAKIQWAVADGVLLLGTEKGEYPVEQLQVQTGTPGPPIFQIGKPTRSGCKRLKPLETTSGRLLFVQRAGRKLLELDFEALRERYKAPDLTHRADHIGKKGFAALAWQAQPEALAWAAQDDGWLAVMVYEPDERVLGWARRQLGNDDFPLLAESICAITDPDGLLDQLWIAAEAPSGDRWILRMAPLRETGADQADAFFVDAGLTYDGAAADEISGLDHLDGATVDILADGKPHRQLVVAGGAVTLDYEAAKVQIGLPYPAPLTLLPLEGGQSEGIAQGKLKRVIDLKLRLIETQGIRVSVQSGDAIPIETRLPDDAMDEAVPLFTGDISLNTIGSYDRLGQITIERFQPTPATIAALFPAVEVGE